MHQWNEETSILSDLKPSETLENPIELGEIIEAPIVVEDTIKDTTPGTDSNEDSSSFLEQGNPYDLKAMETDIHKYTLPMGYNFPFVENTESQDLYLKRKHKERVLKMWEIKNAKKSADTFMKSIKRRNETKAKNNILTKRIRVPENQGIIDICIM